MGCVNSRQKRAASSRVLLVLGLDGAGATTILYQLVLGKRLETIPTLGVNHETVHVSGLDLECWDIGGLDKMRPLWRQYSREADAVLFVVDAAADAARMNLAAEELAKLFGGLGGKKSYMDPTSPLLIFANKQDLPNARSIDAVQDALRLSALPVSTFKVFPCSATDPSTLTVGLEWLAGHLKERPPHPHPNLPLGPTE